MRTYADWKRTLSSVSLPALVCDVEAFDRNAARLVAASRGKPIRIATKSLRVPALIQRALGIPGFRGLLTYDARELSNAQAICASRDTDMLLAYPTLERASLENAVAANAKLRLVVAADDRAHVDVASAAASTVGGHIDICIDVDGSSAFPGVWFGVRRSPIRTPHDVVGLARYIASSASVSFAGIQMYDAQIAGLRDRIDGRGAYSALLRALKARSKADIRQRRAAIVDALRNANLAPRIVTGGGSGSLAWSAGDASLTEITAGSGLLGPHLFDGYDDGTFEPALWIALPATRRPNGRIVTCGGPGVTASGGVGRDRWMRPVSPDGLELLLDEGPGEVQTPVRASDENTLAQVNLGDPILFRPGKAGETCDRFASIVLVREAGVASVVPTYRGVFG